MFFNYSLQVAPGFANVTSITVCTGKLVNNMGLKKVRDGVFTVLVLHDVCSRLTRIPLTETKEIGVR